MVIIAVPNKIRKIKGLLNNGTKWCYLGKEIAKRERIAKALGEKRRFYLKGRVHKISKNLRRDYIDFVARLGKEQKDQLNWWASKFASKSHMQTDFFLLSCYKVLVIELLQRKIDKDRLVIFIEDPWLFIDIKNAYDGRDIKFFGRPNLFLIKSLCIIRGILFRFLLVVWLAVARLLVYCYHKGKNPGILKREKRAVGILNPAEPRAFKNGRYVNNYMPGLPEFYKEKGVPFFYLYLLRFPLSTIKYIGMNKEVLWPLILDVKFSNVIKRIFQWWKPILDKNILDIVAGCNTSVLLEREWYLELSSAGFNVHLILYDTLDTFFKKRWCDSLIYTFENQPWEKMLCMAALKNNIKTIGYQHSVISRFYLSQFIGEGESLFAPLPHILTTSGLHSAQLFEEGRIPEEKIAVGGAWRYPHMINDVRHDPIVKETSDPKQVVLISLPLNISISKSMLEGIFNVVSKNHLDEKMEFWMKPHPGKTPYELSKIENLISKCRIVNKPFNALLKEVDIVISSTSVSGLEGFLCGKKVVNYIPENRLAADPLLDIRDKRIYIWHEGKDIDINFLIDRDLSSGPNAEDINTIRERYFSKINYKMWTKVVNV